MWILKYFEERSCLGFFLLVVFVVVIFFVCFGDLGVFFCVCLFRGLLVFVFFLFFHKLFKGKFLTRNTSLSWIADAVDSYSPCDTEKLSCAGRYISTDTPEVGYLRLLLVTLKSVSYFLSNAEPMQAPHSREEECISAKAFKSHTFVLSPKIHGIYD